MASWSADQEYVCKTIGRALDEPRGFSLRPGEDFSPEGVATQTLKSSAAPSPTSPIDSSSQKHTSSPSGTHFGRSSMSAHQILLIAGITVWLTILQTR
jgi:hypothetical protein